MEPPSIGLSCGAMDEIGVLAPVRLLIPALLMPTEPAGTAVAPLKVAPPASPTTLEPMLLAALPVASPTTLPAPAAAASPTPESNCPPAYEVTPLIRPLVKASPADSPSIAALPAVVAPEAKAPTTGPPTIVPATPAMIGIRSAKSKASGKPVSGLRVKFRPVKARMPSSSFRLTCKSISSPCRPYLAISRATSRIAISSDRSCRDNN